MMVHKCLRFKGNHNSVFSFYHKHATDICQTHQYTTPKFVHYLSQKENEKKKKKQHIKQFQTTSDKEFKHKTNHKQSNVNPFCIRCLHSKKN